jgi:hypothetical protein
LNLKALLSAKNYKNYKNYKKEKLQKIVKKGAKISKFYVAKVKSV